jgi:hypothetical protein
MQWVFAHGTGLFEQPCAPADTRAVFAVGWCRSEASFVSISSSTAPSDSNSMPLLSHAGSVSYTGPQGMRGVSVSATGDDSASVGAAESPQQESGAPASAGTTVLTIAAINAHK